MRKPEIKEIDGSKYRCDMMPVRMAHQTLLSLVSTLGKPVIMAFIEAQGEMNQGAAQLIIGAVGSAFRNLEGEAGDRLIENLFNGVTFEGPNSEFMDLKPTSNGKDDGSWNHEFESHFHGRLLTMYKVWVWSLQVNYSSFLDEAQDLGIEDAKNLGEKVLSSLLTPTSGSGPSSTTTK
jgi:hypothetical protein